MATDSGRRNSSVAPFPLSPDGAGAEEEPLESIPTGCFTSGGATGVACGAGMPNLWRLVFGASTPWPPSTEEASSFRFASKACFFINFSGSLA
ncbi:hypothetical protein SESBI_40992 [Sesbania bispinosa]|nr:hypothetical protein SESBI_40992 [Sesbania bispinosa]